MLFGFWPIWGTSLDLLIQCQLLLLKIRPSIMIIWSGLGEDCPNFKLPERDKFRYIERKLSKLKYIRTLPIISLDYQFEIWILPSDNFCKWFASRSDQTKCWALPEHGSYLKEFFKELFWTNKQTTKKAWPFPRMWRDINAACFANNQLIHHSCMLEPSVVQWINRLPYKPGVTGMIPGFTGLSEETKLWPRPYMILAVIGH